MTDDAIDEHDIAEGSAEHLDLNPPSMKRRQEQIIRLMTQGVQLMNTVRRAMLAILIVLAVLGGVVAYQIDYMSDNRAKLNNLQDSIEETNQTSENVAASYREFTSSNLAFIDNHARTQRLICGWYRANSLPLPDNGDCDNR